MSYMYLKVGNSYRISQNNTVTRVVKDQSGNVDKSDHVEI